MLKKSNHPTPKKKLVLVRGVGQTVEDRLSPHQSRRLRPARPDAPSGRPSGVFFWVGIEATCRILFDVGPKMEIPDHSLTTAKRIL